MAFTDRIQSMVARQRDRFGSSVTIRRVTAGALTAATGKRAETISDTVVTVTRRQVSGDPFSAGGDIRPARECTFTVVASDLAFTPTTADRVIDGSDTWPIVEVGVESDRRVFVLRCRK